MISSKTVKTCIISIILIKSCNPAGINQKIKHQAPLEKSKTEWTLLVYMEADNNLNPFATNNLNDMMRIGSSENVNVLVQCNQNNNQGVWRYKVTRNKLEVDSTRPSNNNDCVADLVDAMKWATSKYPANHYALILWNHGVGIIDPIWGVANPWLAKQRESLNPRINIPGLDLASENIIPEEEHRGILFNETSRTYMNNQQLSQALEEINKIIGKKIDIVGMDACLMAMIEIGYQIKKYTEYLVASQEVEHAYGWFYSAFLEQLSSNKLCALDLAQSIVLTFDLYYKNKTNRYTQSAINLNVIDYLKDNINQTVALIHQCKQYNLHEIKNMIMKARSLCLQFNTPSYIDLYSFYQELLNQIQQRNTKTIAEIDNNEFDQDSGNFETCYTLLPENYYQVNTIRHLNPIIIPFAKPKPQPIQKPQISYASNSPFDSLKECLMNGIKIIESVVIANSCGQGLSKAKGISIYYPHNRIDASYLKTEFAKDSLWLEFLRENI